jgi:hypothetical protein
MIICLRINTAGACGAATLRMMAIIVIDPKPRIERAVVANVIVPSSPKQA